jgi:hypothetical protein
VGIGCLGPNSRLTKRSLATRSCLVNFTQEAQVGMASSPADYRSRLSATQQSRRSRRWNRNSGPVDVDDFFIPASPSSQSRRRAKTPQPSTNFASLGNEASLAGILKESRSQSAPRASQQFLKSPENPHPHDTYRHLRNGDTVFCFQPGRRRQDKVNHRRSSSQTLSSDAMPSEKKSLSHMQHYCEQLKQNGFLSEKDSNFATHNMRPEDLSSEKTSPSQNGESSRSPGPVDPRIFAANYYASKAGIRNSSARNKDIHNDQQPESTDEANEKTHLSPVERTMSQKMADCLLLAKSLYNSDEKDETSRLSNRIHTFCFGTGQADVSTDSIDTVDITDDANGISNDSIVEKPKSRRQDIAGSKKMRSMSKGRTFTWLGDTSTNQSTTATSSCSSSDDDTDLKPSGRPPKILNVTKIPVDTTKKQSSIQLNPDDFDVSYRKPTAKHVDDDYPSVQAIGPLFAGEPPRNLQRRPRGVFEYVMSKDADDGTTCSKPYDETSAHGNVRSKPGMAQNRMQSVTNDSDGVAYDAKYRDSLGIIEKQRKSLSTLEKQLRDALLELDSVKSDFQRSKDEAAKRSQAFEDATAKVFRDRIDTDERLRKEIHVNHQLNDELACLKREMANLSVELERAHHRTMWSALQQADVGAAALADDLSVSSMKSDPVVVKELKTDEVKEATKSIESLTEKLKASEAFAVSLQTQLSGARAADLRTNQTIVELKHERDMALHEIELLKSAMNKSNEVSEDLRRARDLYDNEKQETSRLTREIEFLRNDLCESNFKVNHYSSSLKKFEGEYTRLQLDVAKYQIQVSTLEQQLLKEKENTCNTVRRNSSEIHGLRFGINDTNTQKSSELIRQAAEHVKERKWVEAEVIHRSSPNVQPDGAFNGENDSVCEMNSFAVNGNNLSNMTKEEKRSSSDLLDILRMRLDQR